MYGLVRGLAWGIAIIAWATFLMLLIYHAEGRF